MWKCAHCSAEVEESFEICWKCGRDRHGEGPPPLPGTWTSEAEAQERQPEEPDAPGCPDCGEPMGGIKLIDATHGHGSHVPLEYAALDAKRTLWWKAYPAQGTVEGLLCSGCGRIFLYGRPA